MHLVTDCKEALREAVCRLSERVSPLELSAEHAFKRDIISLDRVQKQNESGIRALIGQGESRKRGAGRAGAWKRRRCNFARAS